MTEHQLLDLALESFARKNVDGEVYLERAVNTRIAVHQGRVESLTERRDSGAGVRIFKDGRTAFAFTSDLSPEGIARAIGTALSIVPHTKQDDANVLPAIASSVPPLVNADPSLESTPIAEKIEIARRAENAARSESPKIQRTRESSYQDFRGTIFIANTRGARMSHEASRCYTGIDLAATDGTSSQTGYCVGWSLGPAALDPTAVGREAARRGLRKLGARQPPTARTPVVLDPEATAGLFGALAPLFSADSVLKKKSLLTGRVGTAIASPHVTLVDDGGIAGGHSSAPVDGEGTPTGATVLVEAGVLSGFFHSVFTARKMEAAPSGNGVRGGYSGAPEPSPTNLYLRPTGIPRDSLIGSVSSGVYVTEMMGLHTVDTISGDFSLGAYGIAIENGRFGGALDRMAISGNVIDLLGSVEAVATDLTFLVTGGGATVLLRDVSISGAGT